MKDAMDYSKEQFDNYHKPCGRGLIVHSKADFKFENTENQLTIKAPRSKVPELVIGAIIGLGGILFMAYMMPELRLLIYTVGVPMLLLLFFLFHKLVGSFRKKGDWLVWDKKTGRIDFPRLAKSDTIGNFLCFQMIYDSNYGEPHTEVNCVFGEGSLFWRYPLFLTDYYGIDSHVFNIARAFGVHVQKVAYDGEKPVVSGFDFINSSDNA